MFFPFEYDTGLVQDESNSAFIHFVGGSQQDYHQNFNSSVYLNYMTDYVFPTASSLFPNSHVIWLQDQASYHMARTISEKEGVNINDKKFPIYKMKSLIKSIPELKYLTNDKGEKVYRFELINPQKRRVAGFNQKTLRTALINWLEGHEKYYHYLLNDFERLAAKNGHIALWNLACHPDFNGIENVWAFVKSLIRKCFFYGRNLSQTEQHLLLAFNGGSYSTKNRDEKLFSCPHDGTDAKGVTPELVQKVILRAYKELQKFGEIELGLEFDLTTYWTSESHIDILKNSQVALAGDEIPFGTANSDVWDRTVAPVI